MVKWEARSPKPRTRIIMPSMRRLTATRRTPRPSHLTPRLTCVRRGQEAWSLVCL
jgi:hypothetical protein